MSGLITALREIWGLFVDDGKLALGLIAWCAVAGMAFHRLSMSREADALLLALGCVAVLIATVLAAGRKRPG